jgi:hypothetical protein
MTVTSATERNDYIGSGSAGPFTYTFKVFAYSHLVAYVTDLSGTISTLNYLSGFTATGANNAAGGTVTLTTALTTGYLLSIQRNVPLTQLSDFRNQAEFFPASYENAVDYEMMAEQQLAANLARCLQLPAASTLTPIMSNFQPSYYLRVNLAGTGIEGVTQVVAAQNFLQSGTGAVVRTANSKMGDVVNAADFGAKGDGITDNATFIQNAINSGAGVVTLLPGTYNFGTGLTIDRCMTFAGASSCGAGGGGGGGQPGAATTQLVYTNAAGVAITLVGSGVEGKENIHLRDFSLWGNATCDGGILVGSTTVVSKSSLKNVHVRGFTKVGGYGVRFGKVIETLFENVYTQDNYDGFVSLSADFCTTLRVVNCHSRSNVRYGTNLSSSQVYGCAFLGLLGEGNGDAGLYLGGAGVVGNEFYSYYSEANNGATGTAPVVIGVGGTGAPSNINFFGGLLSDAVGGLSIDIDKGKAIQFDGMQLTNYATGFMRVTANTSGVVFRTLQTTVYSNNITGYAVGRAIVEVPLNAEHITVSLASNAAVGLAIAAGVFVITDTTNNKVALYNFAGARNLTQELLDPDNAYSITPGNASTINLYYSSGYAIENKTAGTIVVTLATLAADNL